jgi:predicted acyltransferase
MLKPSPKLEIVFAITPDATTLVSATSTQSSSSRSVALDALRGLTVALMLLVNNVALGTFTPAQLQHAAWSAGIHIADLVFPWFLFCAGTALPFAWASARKRHSSRWDWSRKALQRAVTLFALGCFLTSAINHAPTISLGVLQLIGLAGLVAALLEPQRPVLRGGIAALLLIGYWAFLRFTPITGLELGTFEPGRNPAANLNQWLDPYGLRGLPSLIPTTALMLIASLIGSVLQRSTLGSNNLGSSNLGSSKAMRLAIIGIILTALGGLWNLDLEFNKPHWTPAYILFTAGTAALVLAAINALETRFDSRPFWALTVFGSNALLGYIAPILFKTWVLQDWQLSKGISLQDGLLAALVNDLGRVMGGWTYTLGYILACWLVLFWLYRNKIFWRV